jgi:uncharacterized protein
MKYKCPVCGKKIDEAGSKEECSPFCSARCKLIDLGKWLDNEYKIETRTAEKTNDGGNAD